MGNLCRWGGLSTGCLTELDWWRDIVSLVGCKASHNGNVSGVARVWYLGRGMEHGGFKIRAGSGVQWQALRGM